MNQNAQEKIAQQRRLLADALRKQMNDTICTMPDLIPLIPTGWEHRYSIMVNGNRFLIQFWNAEEYKDGNGIRVPTSISGVPSDYHIEVEVSVDTTDIITLVRRGVSFCIDIFDIKRQFGLTNNVT